MTCFEKSLVPKVISKKAIVIGAGPVGLLTARLLNGMTFRHDKKNCKHPFMHRSILDQQIIFRKKLPKNFIGRRGKTAAGQWFDSFFYAKNHDLQTCAVPCLDKNRKIDWALFSKSEAGGGWRSYDKKQRTISPISWVELPDYKIKKDKLIRHYASVENRCKTDSESLCAYYDKYITQLPAKNIHIGSHLISAHKNNNKWHLQFISPDFKMTSFTCTYLILATGRGKIKKLNIPGESLPTVSHSTEQMIKVLKKIKKPAKILVVGTGLSAVDTIVLCWKYGHHVTHLVSSLLIKRKEYYSSESSSKRVMKMRHQSEEYPHHCQVIDAMLSAHKYKKIYHQLLDYQLIEIMNSNICLLKNKKTEHVMTYTYDHIAILAGSTPNFSFLPEKLRTICLENLTRSSMEVQGMKNLFIAGSCSGEWFQRFSLGQAFSIVETIKEREYKKNTL